LTAGGDIASAAQACATPSIRCRWSRWLRFRCPCKPWMSCSAF